MNYKTTDTSNLTLKAVVCGHQHVSKTLRKEAAKTTGDDKWQLKHRKRQLGVETREHLIAYGLLRGISYQRLENKCAERNRPNSGRIAAIIRRHLGLRKPEWTPAKVASLLRESVDR